MNVNRSNKRKRFHTKKSKKQMIPHRNNDRYRYDIALLVNTLTSAESLLHSLEQEEGGIGLYVNANKTDFISFKQEGTISTISGSLLKLVDEFNYLDSNILSTESDVNLRAAQDMDRYWRSSSHVEIWSLRSHKTRFLLISDYDNATL